MRGSGQRFPLERPPGLRVPPPGRPVRLLWSSLLPLVLALPLLLGWDLPAAALSFPWASGRDAAPPAPTAAPGSLQEVSPPPAVRQLQSALASRQPVVEILSPEDDALLEPGPWRLTLRVHDWPLVDGGPLGLGPHLVVQVDGDVPQHWTTTEGLMPELSPGSHLLTVYAALPWGEARKDPGAVRQIRLHRTAVNSLALPAPGTPRLVAVSPPPHAGEEPLLLDWLLLNAPLQNVGGSGVQWRLRAEINGETVLLEQPTALWLQGWKPGLNSVRLELLDGRGSPLNPPFNSLVREVDRSSPPPPARWRGPALPSHDLAVLLGQIPPDLSPTEVPIPAAPAVEGMGPTVVPETAASGEEDTPSGEASVHRPPGTAAASDQSPTPLAPAAAIAKPRPDRPPASDLAAEPPPPRTSPVGLLPAPQAGPASDGMAVPSGEADGGADREPATSAWPAGVGETPLSASGMDDGDSAALPAPQVPAVAPTATLTQDPQEDRTSDAPADPEDFNAQPLAGLMSPGGGPSGQVRGPEALSPADDAGERALDQAGGHPSEAGTPGLSIQAGPLPPTDSGVPAVPEPNSEGPGSAPAADAAMSSPAAEATVPDEVLGMAPESAPEADTAVPPSPAAGEARPAAGADRIGTTTTLNGRARDLVNGDGTLRRPESRGPLAALRDRWQR